MRIAYFDCFAGAAGDMIVAALLDAGCDMRELSSALETLRADGYELRCEAATRGGIHGARFFVDVTADQPARHLGDILEMIRTAGLPPRAAQNACRIFTRLGGAEAKVHDIEVEKVHFHEVGAIDSIVDIVSACVALELLGVESVYCSAIPVGSGTVRCEHGVLPLPAPATAELLTGALIADTVMEGEATTPTAAAILTTLSESFGLPPGMRMSAVGYGAGRRDGGDVPNLLRVFLGEIDDAGDADVVVELSANVDDCTGEVLGAAVEKLLAAGCVDAWVTPIYMKKSRPAWMLSALCPPAAAQRAEEIIFTQTTTFGVRRRLMRRSKLQRRWETVETPYGPIRIKIGCRGAVVFCAAAEFEDCRIAGQAHHKPVREVLQAAIETWRSRTHQHKEPKTDER